MAVLQTLTLSAAAVILYACSAAPPPYVGVWTSFPGLLPHPQLPGVPLLGDTRGYGVALDAHGPKGRPANASGPGRAGALDLWMNANAFWSCIDASDALCAAANVDKEVRACCTTAAFGGVSLLFTPTFTGAALVGFRAEQRIGAGEVVTSWVTPGGGSVTTRTVMATDNSHAAVTTLEYAPAASDPPVLTADVGTWVLSSVSPRGHGPDAGPAPYAVGCADAAGAPVLCSSAAAASAFAARAAATLLNASSAEPVYGALATAVWPASAVAWRYVTSGGGNDTRVTWEATTRVTVPGGGAVAIVSAAAVVHGPAAPDPVPAAAAAAAAAATDGGSAASASAAAFWAAHWAISSVSLPGEPAVEEMFYGNAYALAAFSGYGTDDVPPGLFGPWVTIDVPAWNGDYTLDYNYNAPYFGAFSTGHGAAASALFVPINDFLPSARIKAQGQAARAHVACPSSALYYDCHLGPWGTSSLDQARMPFYMSSNGAYAALAFMDRWDYLQDVPFATEQLWPLLDGLNAWWGCYLNRTATGLPPPHDFVYNDINAFSSDMQHEEQRVPNPAISMAFIRRTVDAQAALALSLSLPLPPIVASIVQQLAPMNTAATQIPAPASGWSAPMPNTRCHAYSDAWSFAGVSDLAACEDACAAQPGCALVSLCPPANASIPPGAGCTGTSGSPRPDTCFGFGREWLRNCTALPDCVACAGWTTAVSSNSSARNASVYTAFLNATVHQSDWLAAYPIWPTAAVDVNSPWLDASPAMTAQESSLVYSDFASGRPVDLFSLAVRAGWGPANTPTRVLRGLRSYLAGYQTRSLLPYAPGGGVENVGINQAVVDMLLASTAVAPPGEPAPTGLAPFITSVFPFWASAQPAAFSGLLAKGGLTVAASYDNVTATVTHVVVAALPSASAPPARRCTLRTPWPAAAHAQVSVACSSGPAAALLWSDSSSVGQPIELLSFDVPVGASSGCTVACAGACGPPRVASK